MPPNSGDLPMKRVLNLRNQEGETPGLWVVDLEVRMTVDEYLGEVYGDPNRILESMLVFGCGYTLVLAPGYLLIPRTLGEVPESRIDLWDIGSGKDGEDQKPIPVELCTVLKATSEDHGCQRDCLGLEK